MTGSLALMIALLIGGYTRHDVGASSTTAGTVNGGAARIRGNGPIITDSHGRLISRRLPPRTVALTFDDGPDPRWTPQVLAVLAREHVPATFFVVGSRAAAHPGLVRREIAGGNEIGSHTFTHTDLFAVPAWRARLELSLNQLALTGDAGITTSLLRLPYTSVPEALRSEDLPTLRRATRAGYTVVLADRDSEDWRRPGADSIVRNALPPGRVGNVILFHDAGGDRAQTVAALPRLIHVLKQRGYRFTTVSGALATAATAGTNHVGGVDRIPGIALLIVLRGASVVTTVVSWLLLPLGLLVIGRSVLLLLFAWRHVNLKRRQPPDDSWLPYVSVVVPAYNEAAGIAAAVRSVACCDYQWLEVIVVDDGSTDETADIVRGLGLPNVRLIRRPNAGKAIALADGIRAARYDVIVMMDGDTIFGRDTIRRLVQPLRDPGVGAVSGNTKVGNRRGLLGRWQHLEYVMGFNLDRRMYDLLHCMPTVPGAVGAFPRAVLEQVGVSDATLAEDTDLTMAVNQAGLHVAYEQRALAWTEAPHTLGGLWRQRYRWCYGTLQAVWKHRTAVRRRRSGTRLGTIGLPYLVSFQFALPLLSPVIDVYALYGLLFLDPYKVAAYWSIFLGIQAISGAYALHLDGERLRALWWLPLQQFVYRQLMYLVVIQSVLTALSGATLRWHKLERTGALTAAAGAPQRVP